MSDELKSKLSKGLTRWAAKNEVRPVDFAEKMGYEYATAWSLLRGNQPFTPEALGRFVLAYGTDEASALLKLCKLPNGVESINLLDGPADALPVIVITKTQAANKSAARS